MSSLCIRVMSTLVAGGVSHSATVQAIRCGIQVRASRLAVPSTCRSLWPKYVFRSGHYRICRLEKGEEWDFQQRSRRAKRHCCCTNEFVFWGKEADSWRTVNLRGPSSRRTLRARCHLLPPACATAMYTSVSTAGNVAVQDPCGPVEPTLVRRDSCVRPLSPAPRLARS